MLSLLASIALLAGYCDRHCSDRLQQCLARCEASGHCERRCNERMQDCAKQCHPEAKTPPPPSEEKFICGVDAKRKPRYCTPEEAERYRASQNEKHKDKDPGLPRQ